MLPNISKIKDNQTIKFGQLTEYKIRSIFLKKSYKKTIPRPFYKKSKLMYLDKQSNVLQSLLSMPS